MSDELINIDKVVSKIGLKENISYDRIEVFVDKTNKDNVWAIVYYTEDRRKSSVLKEKIIRFKNYGEMVLFLKTNFNSYELEHGVDYLHRTIFIHNVDYLHLDYFVHDGNPDLNYMEINYNEYVNDGFHTRKRHIPKEYRDMFLEILYNIKKSASGKKLNGDLYREIDVYARKIKDDEYSEEKTPRVSRKERRKQRELENAPFEEKRKRQVRRIVLIATASTFAALFTAGYVIANNVEGKREVVEQKHASIFGKDATIRRNKEKASEIIEHLFYGDYGSVTQDEIDMVAEFIRNVGQSNFDSNKSSTFFTYDDFFALRLPSDKYDAVDSSKIRDMLKKVEELHNNCFKVIGDVLVFNEKNAQKYLDYVLSLTFMYDTTVDSRGSGLVNIPAQDSNSKYATQEEIMTFNKCPEIIKYMIMGQLRSVLACSNYQVTTLPSNYFGSIEKPALLTRVDKLMDDLKTYMKGLCQGSSKKSI